MSSQTHLIVIVHGIYGKPEMMWHLKAALEKDLGFDQYVIHATVCNSHSSAEDNGRTLDGIDKGGTRVAAEVTALVGSGKYPKLTMISVMGFSLGGLFSRYFVGLCFDKATGLICGLSPVAYVTVSSPHLGVKHLMSGAAAWLKDTFSSLNPPSVQDLFLEPRSDYLFVSMNGYDEGRRGDGGCEEHKGDSGDREKQASSPDQAASKSGVPPLLVTMTRSNQMIPWLEALAAFRFRTVYGNTVNDIPVPYPTGSLNAYFSELLDHHADDSTAKSFQASKEHPSIVGVRHLPPVPKPSKEPLKQNSVDLLTDPRAYFANAPLEDKKLIVEMIQNLSSLAWKRVDVALFKCNSHKCIINNGKLFNKGKGADVAHHISAYFKSLEKLP